MILNLKNKRTHQIDTLHHLINKSSNGVKSHREDQLNLSRQAKQIKTNRINSNHGVKKTTPSGISTTTGANTSSHTHMNTHLSFHRDVDYEQMESSSQEGKKGIQLDHAKVVNVYKKLKKYEMGETSLYPDKTEVLKEPSRQKKCSTHKSQKISHKREITGNIVSPTQHQDDKCDQRISLVSRPNQSTQELVQCLMYLFDTDSTEINAKSRVKTHRERQYRDKPLFQERRQDQMLIREDQSIEVRPSGQDQVKSVEAILGVFLGRMSVVQSRLKGGNSQEHSKHSSNRNEPRMSANKHFDYSASRLLMHIKSFVEELMVRMCEESSIMNTHFTKIAQNLSLELEESTLECEQLSADLQDQLMANQKLIQQVLQMQNKSSNSMVIFNELSKNFDMERFVQNRFTPVGQESLREQSLQESSCFVKSKEPQQIQASDSMYEVVGKHHLALNLQKFNSKKGAFKIDSATNKPESHRNLERGRF